MKTREQVYEEVNQHLTAAYAALINEDGKPYYEDINMFAAWDSGEGQSAVAMMCSMQTGARLIANTEHINDFYEMTKLAIVMSGKI